MTGERFSGKTGRSKVFQVEGKADIKAGKRACLCSLGLWLVQLHQEGQDMAEVKAKTMEKQTGKTKQTGAEEFRLHWATEKQQKILS